MRKLLIFIPILATLGISGCSSFGEGLRSLGGVTKIIPNAIDKTPFVYRPPIQQGNVVTQEQVNELKPGMTKRQVKFLLGTPMLSDVFHSDRWDYAYTFGEGSTPSDSNRVTVFFEQERLVRVAGDLRPQPESERKEKKKEVVVSVPDWVPPKKTLWGKALDTMGIESE